MLHLAFQEDWSPTHSQHFIVIHKALTTGLQQLNLTAMGQPLLPPTMFYQDSDQKKNPMMTKSWPLPNNSNLFWIVHQPAGATHKAKVPMNYPRRSTMTLHQTNILQCCKTIVAMGPGRTLTLEQGKFSMPQMDHAHARGTRQTILCHISQKMGGMLVASVPHPPHPHQQLSTSRSKDLDQTHVSHTLQVFQCRTLLIMALREEPIEIRN